MIISPPMHPHAFFPRGEQGPPLPFGLAPIQNKGLADLQNVPVSNSQEPGCQRRDEILARARGDNGVVRTGDCGTVVSGNDQAELDKLVGELRHPGRDLV